VLVNLSVGTIVGVAVGVSGTGVGFSLVVDGALTEKSPLNHLAGHILIRDGAQTCYCGLSGCLESLVSAQALVESFHALLAEKQDTRPEPAADAQAVFAAAGAGHPTAALAVHNLVRDLTLGLNVYIHLFAPETIILGGGMAKALTPHLPQIRAELFALPYTGYEVRLTISQLGEKAGVFGAAALCHRIGERIC